MKSTQLILALAAASLSFSAVAADSTSDGKGKTRQEVRQELTEAQHNGQVPARNADYPPSKDTVKRNQQSHKAAVHPKNEKTNGIDSHDDRGGAKQ